MRREAFHQFVGSEQSESIHTTRPTMLIVRIAAYYVVDSVSGYGDQPTRLRCPNCGSEYVYQSYQLESDGYYHCQNCGMAITNQGLPLSGSEGPQVTGPGRSEEPVWVERATGARIRCPACGASYLYDESMRKNDGTFSCQNCGQSVRGEAGERVVVQTTTSTSKSTNWGIVAIGVLVLLFVPLLLGCPLGLFIIYYGCTHGEESKTSVTRTESGASIA